MKKRVLFVIESLSGGGAEKVLSTIVKNIDKTKFDITVLTVVKIGVYVEEVEKYCTLISMLPEYEKLTNPIDKIKYKVDYRKIYKEDCAKIYKKYVKNVYDVEIAFVEGFVTKLVANSTNKYSKKYAWIHTDMIKNNQLLEYANYVGNYYGTPRDFVEKNINEGNNVILEIETQGALQVKKMMPEAVMIFVLPPNADTLKERLVGRQTETMEVINKRLSKAAEETGVIDKYDYFVINDEIADCAARINDIVTDNNTELIGSDCVNKIKNDILKFSKGE